MPRTGNFGGFEFDEEVFAGMMQEADYWTTPILASGIVQQDSSIMDLIGEHGNVATIPIYKPIDANESGMEALNNDGLTDNTPVEISGDKQTCMLIQRMKAFKAKLIDYAEKAYKTAGMSSNQYMDTATSFAASLIQGLGGDTAKAVELTNLAITDMSDNANKMGTDIGSIQDACCGTGNTLEHK